MMKYEILTRFISYLEEKIEDEKSKKVIDWQKLDNLWSISGDLAVQSIKQDHTAILLTSFEYRF